jgi:hypothetical protein
MYRRVAAMFVNGEYLGEAFSNLPDVVYPIVTFSAENISAGASPVCFFFFFVTLEPRVE